MGRMDRMGKKGGVLATLLRSKAITPYDLCCRRCHPAMNTYRKGSQGINQTTEISSPQRKGHCRGVIRMGLSRYPCIFDRSSDPKITENDLNELFLSRNSTNKNFVLSYSAVEKLERRVGRWFVLFTFRKHRKQHEHDQFSANGIFPQHPCCPRHLFLCVTQVSMKTD